MGSPHKQNLCQIDEKNAVMPENSGFYFQKTHKQKLILLNYLAMLR